MLIFINIHRLTIHFKFITLNTQCLTEKSTHKKTNKKTSNEDNKSLREIVLLVKINRSSFNVIFKPLPRVEWWQTLIECLCVNIVSCQTGSVPEPALVCQGHIGTLELIKGSCTPLNQPTQMLDALQTQ